MAVEVFALVVALAVVGRVVVGFEFWLAVSRFFLLARGFCDSLSHASPVALSSAVWVSAGVCPAIANILSTVA